MLRRNVTPSLIVSIIALFVALGGVSYAAVTIPKNSVGSAQLKDNSVGTKELEGLFGGHEETEARLCGDQAAEEECSYLQEGPQRFAACQGLQVRPTAPRTQGRDRSHGTARGHGTSGDRRTHGPCLSLLNDLSPSPTASRPLSRPRPCRRGPTSCSWANVLGGGGVTSTVICSIENDAAQNFTVGSGGGVALAQTATVTLDSPGSVTLSCLKSSGSPEVAQASITAIQVGSITGS